MRSLGQLDVIQAEARALLSLRCVSSRRTAVGFLVGLLQRHGITDAALTRKSILFMTAASQSNSEKGMSNFCQPFPAVSDGDLFLRYTCVT